MASIIDEDFLLTRKRAMEFCDCVLTSGRTRSPQVILLAGMFQRLGIHPGRRLFDTFQLFEC